MSIRSACDRGFTTYLAEQHQTSLQGSLAKGVAVGGVITGGLWGADQVFKLNIPWWAFLSTFSILTFASIGQGVVTLNSEDLEHKAAFDAVCSKYAKESGE